MNRRVSFHAVHGVAGVLALLIIAAFWSATVAVELFGEEAAVANVKSAIAWSLLVFVPVVTATAASGLAMSPRKRTGPTATKLRRMPIIAANGLLILVPSALYLAWKANAGQFDAAFIAVQIAELAAGAVNATLIALNIRDGFRLSGRFVRSSTHGLRVSRSSPPSSMPGDHKIRMS